MRLWREDHPELELFFLSPYAPEINPHEYLTNDVHAHVARKRPSTLPELTNMAIDYLNTRTKTVVTSYFKAPLIRYAQ